MYIYFNIKYYHQTVYKEDDWTIPLNTLSLAFSKFLSNSSFPITSDAFLMFANNSFNLLKDRTTEPSYASLTLYNSPNGAP